MPTIVNKQRLVMQLLAAGQVEDSQGPELPVLEQLVYAICRENATREQAERAYSRLVERFFDWNEVRVSSVRELEEALHGLHGAEMRAQRILSMLQEVFEDLYSFNLEDELGKAGVKKACERLVKYKSVNAYMAAWVTQRALGGHAIPVDSRSLRCARRLGLLEESQQDLESARTSLEHLVQKTKGLTFVDRLSRVAVEYCQEEPHCGPCPLHGECPSAQVIGVESGPVARAPRPKPR